MAYGPASKRLRRIDPHLPAECIVATTRFLNAMPETVFAAFTKPRHLIHWWLAPGFTVTTHSQDLVPGGVWWSTVRRFDGHMYLQGVTYSDIEWARVLSYYAGVGADLDLLQNYITFEEAGNKTKVTMLGIFESPEARDYMIANQFPEDSQSYVLDRLSEYMERINA